MTTPARFDLQSHSTCSDGELAPAAVVAAAAAAGVQLLALTDHDTIAGVSEAVAAAEEHLIGLVPAIEISAVDDGADTPRELHILGYQIDHEDSRLQEKLTDFLGDRERRTLRMRDALSELGFQLDEAEIEARMAEGRPIGRPHLAAAALSHSANQERLESEGIAEIGAMIKAYLIEGKPAFRLRETPTVAEAVEAIHAAAGSVIWAHPFWDISEPDEVLQTIDRFKDLGVDGVETFYITHTESQTRLLVNHCSQLGLLTTGSADFHGPSNSLFSKFLAFEKYGLTPNLGPIAG